MVPTSCGTTPGADGVLHALSAESGAVVWKRAIGSRILTAVVLLSDELCFGTRDGRVLDLLLVETLKGAVYAVRAPGGGPKPD